MAEIIRFPHPDAPPPYEAALYQQQIKQRQNLPGFLIWGVRGGNS